MVVGRKLGQASAELALSELVRDLLFQAHLFVRMPMDTHRVPRVNNMSRPSIAPQRALTLTEELEKLEQSITLTLQG